jgi:hypothetical protein
MGDITWKDQIRYQFFGTFAQNTGYDGSRVLLHRNKKAYTLVYIKEPRVAWEKNEEQVTIFFLPPLLKWKVNSLFSMRSCTAGYFAQLFTIWSEEREEHRAYYYLFVRQKGLVNPKSHWSWDIPSKDPMRRDQLIARWQTAGPLCDCTDVGPKFQGCSKRTVGRAWNVENPLFSAKTKRCSFFFFFLRSSPLHQAHLLKKFCEKKNQQITMFYQFKLSMTSNWNVSIMILFFF